MSDLGYFTDEFMMVSEMASGNDKFSRGHASNLLNDFEDTLVELSKVEAKHIDRDDLDDLIKGLCDLRAEVRDAQ